MYITNSSVFNLQGLFHSFGAVFYKVRIEKSSSDVIESRSRLQGYFKRGRVHPNRTVLGLVFFFEEEFLAIISIADCG